MRTISKFGMKGFALVAPLVLLLANPLAAQQVSKDKIIDALTPKRPLSRGLTKTPAEVAKEAETAKFIDTIRNRPTRSLSMGERNQIAKIAEDRPKIDLEIKFEFNSAQIASTARADLEALGKALSDSSFKGSSFVLAGHTDIVGSEDFNQDLSERRAEAVKRHLIENYGLAPDHLLTVGYGKSRLKNQSSPRAAENRRVEVINAADK